MDVLTTTEMERADRLTIAAGTPGFALMMSAGQAVAEAAMGLVEEGPIVVVAGRGNNGGDGFVAAAELAARGRDVSVILLCERDSLKGDAALAARGWKYPVLPFNPQAIGRPALIIDALFGAGLDRPVKGDPLEVIEAVNANGAPVLAVDLPSGINGTTGAVMGAAINAVETVTFFRRKPGHLLMPGRKHCGRVRVADIGIDARVLEEIKPQTFENVPSSWQKSFPVPVIDGHKYARGHAVVVSGELASTGAARLAARGALRAGAGLVTVASPREALAVNAAALTAVMVRAIDNAIQFAELLDDTRLGTVVIGPGAGVSARTRDFVHAALSAKRSLVLDADALTSFAEAPERLFESIKASGDARVVLTPHEGEFRAAVQRHQQQASRPLQTGARARRRRALRRRRAAEGTGHGGRLTRWPRQHRLQRAALARHRRRRRRAGRHDRRALAQGVPAFEAACIGVWMHGEAASEAGPGLIAEDLPEVLPAVFRRLYDEFGVEY